MKNILLINGHEYHNNSTGKLNETLLELIKNTLKGHYSIRETIIKEGYDVKIEQSKFEWADIVIFQTPIFWFNFPALCKKYIDEVYEHGKFYSSSSVYGDGGKMKGKKYMLSVTWAAPQNVFSNMKEPFLEGKNVDDVLIAMHKTQQFVGLEKLPTLSNHSAY
ncbi:hypothetical protein ASS83_10975 [Staphylococcus saprophyticus]|uniref:NAD(P)H-dependent oxidoreductase n=2 Tax=cellular organisms TaxID=131567 RepID=UPI00085325BA|nr:NAD(P)H-dependent oxidoreductase [Staphylococcus saprophyticus]OEK22080.1 hypothetical protein ASS83_10975 [Staphylococcus saprophyticus]